MKYTNKYLCYKKSYKFASHKIKEVIHGTRNGIQQGVKIL